MILGFRFRLNTRFAPAPGTAVRCRNRVVGPRRRTGKRRDRRRPPGRSETGPDLQGGGNDAKAIPVIQRIILLLTIKSALSSNQHRDKVMQDYQRDFIRLALHYQALRFGLFTLKSGRSSPYFFNAGLFNSGKALAELGRHYAAALVDSGIDFDMLFGPAYKGIPLAAATAIALADQHGMDRPYAFNRKEAKDHGEGGNLIGAPLAGRVLIVDDVITAGTAVREVIELIRDYGAQPAGVIIGLNRQERGRGELSAIQEVEQEFAIPVISIAAVDHIIAYLEEEASDKAIVEQIRQYRVEYGVNSDH